MCGLAEPPAQRPHPIQTLHQPARWADISGFLPNPLSMNEASTKWQAHESVIRLHYGLVRLDDKP